MALLISSILLLLRMSSGCLGATHLSVPKARPALRHHVQPHAPFFSFNIFCLS